VGTSNSHILRAFKELLPGIKYHKTKTVVVFVIVLTFQYLVNASECMLRLQSFKNVEIPNPFSSIVHFYDCLEEIDFDILNSVVTCR
jgi:hypothetical protein